MGRFFERIMIESKKNLSFLQEFPVLFYSVCYGIKNYFKTTHVIFQACLNKFQKHAQQFPPNKSDIAENADKCQFNHV